MIKTFPDLWVILKDCEWENKSTIKNGILVDVCGDEEISKKKNGKSSFRQKIYL